MEATEERNNGNILLYSVCAEYIQLKFTPATFFKEVVLV